MKPFVLLICHFTFAVAPVVAEPAGESNPSLQERSASVPDGAEPLANWEVPGISAWSHGNQLFLVLNREPAEGLVKIPRLANVVQTIHWVAEPDTELKVQPEPVVWIINVQPSASIKTSQDAPSVLVLKLDAPACIFDKSTVSEPDAAGILLLPAKYAATHGENLRFEPQPHKNTVGYWSNEKDFADWHYVLSAAGEYEVDVLQGCGKGHGGSKVELRTESATLAFSVQETGHFQNFIWRTVGTVNLKATDHGSLSLVPLQKVAGAVMDVRAIRLVPIGCKRSFEPQLADPSALPAAK